MTAWDPTSCLRSGKFEGRWYGIPKMQMKRPRMFPFSSFFHVIVTGFAVQRCPCWEDLGGGDEVLQKGVILGLIG
jgi:hypothetical protein